MGWLRRIDRFLLAIVAAAVLATLLPATGTAADALGWATKAMVAALFFLYGVRLQPEQALAGLRHWRLHLTILAFTFVTFPLLGLALRLLPESILSATVYPGLLYLCLVPSTVQSSITFTSIARGNVAGAIVSASLSNLLGVVVTPLLCWTLLRTTGLSFQPATILDVIGQLLVPFLLGQLSRRWTRRFVAAHPRLRLFDQASIVVVVYGAFSAGAREGLWGQVTGWDLTVIVLLSVALLAVMLWVTWFAASRLGFDRADAITIQMCGTKKSLATGLPMASLLFAGHPIGLLVLPLMVFHQAQLLACGALAARYARRD